MALALSRLLIEVVMSQSNLQVLLHEGQLLHIVEANQTCCCWRLFVWFMANFIE